MPEVGWRREIVVFFLITIAANIEAVYDSDSALFEVSAVG